MDNKEFIKIIEDSLYQEIDGFYVFNTENGCLYPHQLRIIADELDERNKDWNDRIDKYHQHIT